MNQAVQAPRRFTDDRAIRERIVRETLEAVGRFDLQRSPPEMGGILNAIICRALGDPDPYLAEKRRFNKLALGWLPELRRLVTEAEDPFAAAVRMAIAANIIDFGAPFGQTGGEVIETFRNALNGPLRGAGQEGVHRLHNQAQKAEKIFYLADNAGEIVVDILLIEQLPRDRVTVVVRDGPAINDALMEDALVAGLGDCARIMSSGVALPGTPPDLCSRECAEQLEGADLVISKGQGNYETLSDHPREITFLLVAKCQTVARQLNSQVGDFIIAQPSFVSP